MSEDRAESLKPFHECLALEATSSIRNGRLILPLPMILITMFILLLIIIIHK